MNRTHKGILTAVLIVAAVVGLLLLAVLPGVPDGGIPAPEEQGDVVTLVAGGDLSVGPGIGAVIDKKGLEWVFGAVRPNFEGADLVFANLEVVLTDRLDQPRPQAKRGRLYHIHASPSRVELLKQMGVGVVSLANNHAGDYTCQGIEDTMGALTGAGIASGGAGVDIAQARAPVVRTVKGVRVGFVFFSALAAPTAATPERCGIHFLSIRKKRLARTIKRLAAEIATLRRRADVVLVSAHWRTTSEKGALSPMMVEAGHAIIDAGADGVLGHGNHVMLGMESYKDRPILYDMGNFLFGQRKGPWLRRQGHWRLELTKEGVRSVELLPYVLGREMHAHIPKDRLAATIRRRIRERTVELGSSVLDWEGRLLLDLGKPLRP